MNYSTLVLNKFLIRIKIYKKIFKKSVELNTKSFVFLNIYLCFKINFN